jgi:hypothetical protein
LINAKGFTDVTVSFDYVAGGERDNLESSTIFDYGAFNILLMALTFTLEVCSSITEDRLRALMMGH